MNTGAYIFCLGVILGICVVDAAPQDQMIASSQVTREAMKGVAQISAVVLRLQRERGMTSTYVTSKGDGEEARTALERLYYLRNDTNMAIEAVEYWPGNESDEDGFQTKAAFLDYMKRHRDSVTQGDDFNRHVQFYSDTNAILNSWFIREAKVTYGGPLGSDNEELWKTLVALDSVQGAKERTGIDRAMGSAFFGAGGFTDSELLEYIRIENERNLLLRQATLYNSQLSAKYDQLLEEHADLVADVEAMKDEIHENNQPGPNTEKSLYWFDQMTEYINVVMNELETFVQSSISNKLDDLENRNIDCHATH